MEVTKPTLIGLSWKSKIFKVKQYNVLICKANIDYESEVADLIQLKVILGGGEYYENVLKTTQGIPSFNCWSHCRANEGHALVELCLMISTPLAGLCYSTLHQWFQSSEDSNQDWNSFSRLEPWPWTPDAQLLCQSLGGKKTALPLFFGK